MTMFVRHARYKVGLGRDPSSTHMRTPIPNSVSPHFLFRHEQNIDDGDVRYHLILSGISDDPAYNSAMFENITADNVDDDFAGVVFTVHGSSAVTYENSLGTPIAAFDVRLLSEPLSSVTVTALSDDTTEGIVSSKPMLFTKDDWEIPQQLELVGVDDMEADGDISYAISLTANSDDASYSNLLTFPLQVINKDDDAAGFSLAVGSKLDPLANTPGRG